MKYYAELPSGERKPINEWMYRALTGIHGWIHVMRESHLEIIRKG